MTIPITVLQIFLRPPLLRVTPRADTPFVDVSRSRKAVDHRASITRYLRF